LQKITKYDFVYPYVNGEDRFEELRYSLRSLEMHFKEPFNVIIVGDCPEWLKDAIYIPHTRQTGMHENILFDAISKMKMICSSPLVNSYFIRMFDDIYLLQDMTFETINMVRALYNMDEHDRTLTDGTASNTWRRQLWRTYDALKSKGQPAWNTETHLPEVYLKSVMNYVIDEFQALEKRLLMSTLYHNVILNDDTEKPRIVNIRSNDKAGFYGVSSDFSYNISGRKKILDLLNRKLFLNHNDPGLSRELEDVIKELFPIKCRFEK